MFQASFVSALLLFWLCVYHGLRQNDRRFLIFYLPKILLVGAIWLSMVTVAVWQEYDEMEDPTFSYQLDTDHFYVTRKPYYLFDFLLCSAVNLNKIHLGFQSVLLCRLCRLPGLPVFTHRKSLQ